MVKRIWKVYGIDGHRQRESFSASYSFEIGNGNVTVINSDITGTNLYSIMYVEATTSEECEIIFMAQMSDGVFENSNVGRILEIDKNELIEILER